jgi:hypothetical protein
MEIFLDDVPRLKSEKKKAYIILVGRMAIALLVIALLIAALFI